MTRKVVYGVSLVGFVAAAVMTIAAIIIPRWISWDSYTVSGEHIHYTYGLHKRCSSLTGLCHHFPQYDDCHGQDRQFCSLWRSVGFLMSFAVVMEGMTVITFCVLIAGGKQKRATGWKVLSLLLIVTALVQCAAMSIVAYVNDTDERFFIGWYLDLSWTLCTVSWSIIMLSAVAIMASAWVLPPEGGYELIPSIEETEIRGRR